MLATQRRRAAARATRVKRERGALPSPHFAGPYSPHGEIPRLAERQGSGASDAREGGARAAGADRAALEKLLNPGIAKGTAGVGSQTGLNGQEKPKPRSGRLPGEGVKEAEPKTGLQPPADNSWDRREDFSAAHRARKSTREARLDRSLRHPPPEGASGAATEPGSR